MSSRSPYKSLLPSDSNNDSNSSNEQSTSRSSSDPSASSGKLASRIVKSACLECRRRKIKCDGARPICNVCASQRLQCTYDRDQDTAPITMLRKTNAALTRQVSQLQGLYDMIRTRNEADATQIMQRIRTTEDPLQVFQMVDAAGLLEGMRAPYGTNPRLQEIWAPLSQISIQAWTTIGDEEVVAELLSVFFAEENPYHLGFIDRDCFLEGMRTGNGQGTKYCSRLLLHAICAISSFSSPAVKRFNRAKRANIRQQFIDEALRLLRQPLDNGSASLPTIQAFYLVSVYQCAVGLDRNTLTQRCSEFSAVQRLTPASDYFPTGPLPEQTVASDRRAISTIVWGSYYMASLNSMCYMRSAPADIPSMPRYFMDQLNEDALVEGNEEARPEPSTRSARLLNALCDISVTLHDNLTNLQTDQSNAGKPAEVEKRTNLFERLLRLRRELPDDLSWDKHRTSHSLYLSNYFDYAVISMFRSLPWSTEILLDQGITTAGAICRFYCQKNLHELDELESSQDHPRGSLAPLYAPHHPSIVALTLVPHLADPDTHDPFTKACALCWRESKTYPVARSELAALLHAAKRHSITIPARAVPYFHDLEEHTADPKILLNPVLPQFVEMVTDFSNNGRETGIQIGPQLDQLIEKWTALTLGVEEDNDGRIAGQY